MIWMLQNLQFMINTETSECAVQADYDREMIVVRQMDGGVDHVNSLVKGVVRGAKLSIRLNILEIDTALCGENELLLNMKMFSLSDEEEMRLAKEFLCVALYFHKFKGNKNISCLGMFCDDINNYGMLSKAF